MRPSTTEGLLPGKAEWDGVAWHVTTQADIRQLETSGVLSSDLSAIRKAYELLGTPMPADDEAFSDLFQFPWGAEKQKASGEPGRHEILSGLLRDYFKTIDMPVLIDEIRVYIRATLYNEVKDQPGVAVGKLDLSGVVDRIVFYAITRLIGFPPSSELEVLRKQFSAIVSGSFERVFKSEPLELRLLVQDLIANHRGADDLLARIQEAGRKGKISKAEQRGLVLGTLVAGYRTTSALVLLVLGLVDEAKFSAMLVGCHGDNEVYEAVIAEALRFMPLSAAPRVCVTQTKLVSGRTIKPQQLVFLHLDAANVDPEVFGPNAQEFHPGRITANRQIAFGVHGSLHYCLGAHLGAALTKAIVQTFYDCLGGIVMSNWNRTWGVAYPIEAQAEFSLVEARSRIGLAE